MNLPLNIDVQQILLHVLNFSVLALGLYLLLYRPVKKFTGKRAEYFQNLEETANKSASDAETARAEYENRLKHADEEIAEKRADALRSAEEERSRILAEANEQSRKIKDEATAAAAIEHERMIRKAKSDISDMIITATENIISCDTSDNRKIFDCFLDSVGEESENGGKAEQ